jgi:DNA-binding LacI/PurR family transcriptional regulator
MPIAPTLADVARAAGVSLATASRVLSGFEHVRPETRRQVEQAVSQLGYVRQRTARAPATRRTGVIAVVICESGDRLFADPYFGQIMRGISSVLAGADHQHVLLTMDPGQQLSVRHLCGEHVDGALLVSAHAGHAATLERIRIPVVTAGQPARVDPHLYSYVDVDNHGGAARAVRYLVNSGRTRIATIAGPKDMTAGIDRLAGYRHALDPHERQLVVHGDFSVGSGEHAMRTLLDRRPDVDAVFAASDLMALGALRALRRLGRRVPDDVAVVGFDNSPVAPRTEPPLTTIRQPVEEVGARSARQLLRHLNEATPRPLRTVLSTGLVVRASA